MCWCCACVYYSVWCCPALRSAAVPCTLSATQQRQRRGQPVWLQCGRAGEMVSSSHRPRVALPTSPVAGLLPSHQWKGPQEPTRAENIPQPSAPPLRPIRQTTPRGRDGGQGERKRGLCVCVWGGGGIIYRQASLLNPADGLSLLLPSYMFSSVTRGCVGCV